MQLIIFKYQYYITLVIWVGVKLLPIELGILYAFQPVKSSGY